MAWYVPIIYSDDEEDCVYPLREDLNPCVEIIAGFTKRGNTLCESDIDWRQRRFWSFIAMIGVYLF